MREHDPMLRCFYSRVLGIEVRWARFMDSRPDLKIKDYNKAYLGGIADFYCGPEDLRAADLALGRTPSLGH